LGILLQDGLGAAVRQVGHILGKRLADFKAKKLEATTAAISATQCRQAVGTPSGKTTMAATPTRLAYRWIKSPASWSQSLV